MPTENRLGHETGQMFNREAWLGEFQTSLESNSPPSVSEWVSEIPHELRSDVVPHLLKRYIDFFRLQGWTVNLASLLENLPEFQPLIWQLHASSLMAIGADDTVRTSSLHATTTYEVETRKWKEGGQGVLHKAVENGIGGRQVVVKYLKDADHEGEFQKEIEVTSRLEHPGVAAVFSYGVEDSLTSRPFYAMRLIHGKSLEDCIADFHNRMSHENASPRSYFDRLDENGIAPILESIISACHTVAHAHSVGVLHCDLKPKNIVCGSFRATIVLDWGSARSFRMEDEVPSDSAQPIVLSEETGGSHTIGYASPEQLEHQELSRASDVFCLGATLYHALTGRAPFRADRHPTSKCALPRELNAGVPKRLERICVKAMQPTAEARYQNAEHLARDLTHWLRDEAVSAAPDTLTDRAFRVARHHKQATAVGFIAVFGLMFLGFTAWNLAIQQRMVSASLGSAFSLIEDLCKPLEDDAISNSSEFQLRADQVASLHAGTGIGGIRKWRSNSMSSPTRTTSRRWKFEKRHTRWNRLTRTRSSLPGDVAISVRL